MSDLRTKCANCNHWLPELEELKEWKDRWSNACDDARYAKLDHWRERDQLRAKLKEAEAQRANTAATVQAFREKYEDQCERRQFAEYTADKNYQAYTLENAKVAELFAEKERLLKRVRELESKQRWIPVSERLPDESWYVICLHDDGDGEDPEITTGVYSSIRHRWHTYGLREPSHWMPLPEAPKL